MFHPQLKNIPPHSRPFHNIPSHLPHHPQQHKPRNGPPRFGQNPRSPVMFRTPCFRQRFYSSESATTSSSNFTRPGPKRSDSHWSEDESANKTLQLLTPTRRRLLMVALEDAFVRFLLLLPEEMYEDSAHFCFQVEEAHWWYSDIWVDQHREELPHLSFKDFFVIIHSLFLKGRLSDPLSEMVFHWRAYTQEVPLCGLVIMDPTCSQTVLVRGFNGCHWTFPRGKINEMESEETCAVREGFEELGVDFSPYLKEETLYIERKVKKQTIKLFVIQPVSLVTKFLPKNRKEIGGFGWVEIETLPNEENGGSVLFNCMTDLDSGGRSLNWKFKSVVPFSVAVKECAWRMKENSRRSQNL